MKLDTVNPTLARIYTANENIKGILERLEVIMDDKSYQELYGRYLEIAKEVPQAEILTEYEEEYGAFGTDLKYGSLDNKLRVFENSLDIYDDYKDLSDMLNKVKGDMSIIFNEEISVEDFIEENERFVELLLKAKDNKTIHQFTDLFNDSIKTLFGSLKTLSFIGNDELVKFVIATNSDYLKEHLGSEIRRSIDTTSYEGRLDEDYVDSETLYKCALNDCEIIAREAEARDYREKQDALAKERDEHISHLKDKIQVFEETIKKYQGELKNLKLKKTGLMAKRFFLKCAVIPAIAIPLSCPLIGRHIGQKESSKVVLTKTITNTVDTDSGDIVLSEEEYNELKTDYVASVTICEPWKRNASGTSYTRECTVYDYDFSELGELADDFHLTLENIELKNLIRKYSYQEPTGKVENDKYLNEKQVYITETYQDANITQISDKYNIPYTVAGVGVGILAGTTELLAYLYADRRMGINFKRKIDKALMANKYAMDETKKVLKLTIDNRETAKREYDSMTIKR